MRYLYLLIMIWGFLGLSNARAQQEQLLRFENIGALKGLNAVGINHLYQDSVGFLWIATTEGLFRFDGQNIRHFRKEQGDSLSLNSSYVKFVTEDREGNIWVALARGGVSCYNRKTGKFRNYPFTDKLKIKTVSVWYILFDRDDEIWLGISNYGLAHLDRHTGEVETFPLVTAESAPELIPEMLSTSNISQHLWQDENGLLWCATPDDLYSFDTKTQRATSHRFEKKAFDGTPLNGAAVLLPDGDYLWVGGWASGLRRFNRKTGEWKQFMLEEYPISPDAVNIIRDIRVKSADELWITSTDKGFGTFNKKTGKFYIYGNDPLYPDFPTILGGSLCIDRQANIWMTYKDALWRLQVKNTPFHFNETFSKRLGKEAIFVSSYILDDRDDHFRLIGYYSGDGLKIIDKRTGKTSIPTFQQTQANAESNQFVIDLLEARDGTIWVLGKHLLYRFNPQTLQLDVPPQPPLYLKELGSNFYNQITEDLEGNLWLCTSLSGVFKYDPATGACTHFMPDENKKGAISTHVVGSVKTDRRGRVWYGSRNNTSYGYYLPQDGLFYYLDANGEPTTNVSTLRMNSFIADHKGDIWACTEQGMLHFDCSGETPRLVKKYNRTNGLSSDFVSGGVEDDRGNIWTIGTNQLCKLDPQTGKVAIFDGKDGVVNAQYGLCKLSHGQLAIRGVNGYYTFYPDSLSAYYSQAPVVLTSFKVNDEEIYLGSVKDLNQAFIVPDFGRYFTIEFTALDLTHPELSRYEYQLEGLDKQWVKAGLRGVVNYTNVPAGRYHFKVKQEGRPDSEALVLPLIVRVNFYKTSWFWTLVVVSFLLAVWYYFRSRQQQRQQVTELLGKAQLLEKEKALVQYESLKQQLNPHFLFNSLTSLGSLISIDPKTAAKFLESLSKTYRYILNSSERELVPLIEELKFGEAFVNLQKTRFGEGLQVHFNIGEQDYHRKIVPVTLQNLIENAIKHNIIDQEEPLVIEVWVAGAYLAVRNNLQKKKFVETSNKRGLANLQSFYRYLSVHPILIQEDDQYFTIQIPLL